jgi:hypothetical protein
MKHIHVVSRAEGPKGQSWSAAPQASFGTESVHVMSCKAELQALHGGSSTAIASIISL